MLIDVDVSELEILEVALDLYRREVKRERKDLKLFLKKVKAIVGLTKVSARYEEEREKLRVLETDMMLCHAIKTKLQRE